MPISVLWTGSELIDIRLAKKVLFLRGFPRAREAISLQKVDSLIVFS